MAKFTVTRDGLPEFETDVDDVQDGLGLLELGHLFGLTDGDVVVKVDETQLWPEAISA